VRFSQSLQSGILIKRYKRFLADIRLDNNEVSTTHCRKVITAHCPNSGSMKSCKTDGWPVLLSYNPGPKRKYPYTWEMVYNGVCWIGINTGIPNRIVYDAISDNNIPELTGYTSIRREVPYGKNSRIDILLNKGKDLRGVKVTALGGGKVTALGGEKTSAIGGGKTSALCYVEVKNVTLVEEDGCYYFPDSVTERGRKHLLELMECVRQGQRAVMFFCIQRSDGSVFKPAAHIDPAYAETLKEAQQAGVELLAYRADVSPEQIVLSEKISYKI
jgi:sugar fermentation stimulation protein A